MNADIDQILTSADARLRNKIPMVRNGARIPAEYTITAEAFPELINEFEKIQRVAEAKGYRIVVLENFGGAGVDFERKIIGIGSRKLNSMSFDAVLGVIAHELGHVYRHQNPDAPLVGRPAPELTAARSEEIEADRLGACLTGSTLPLLNALSSGRPMDEGLPNSLRLEALGEFTLAQCPAPLRSKPGRER